VTRKKSLPLEKLVVLITLGIRKLYVEKKQKPQKKKEKSLLVLKKGCPKPV